MYSYEKERHRLEKLMEECLNESDEESMESNDESEESEEAEIEECNFDSESEQEIVTEENESDVEMENEFTTANIPYFVGKEKTDKTKWYKHIPTQNVRVRAHNLVKHMFGAKAAVLNLKRPIDIWKHFFTDQMINEIVNETNKHIELNQHKYARVRDANPTDSSELQAVFGLLYLSSVLKSGRVNVKELWSSSGLGIEIFRLTLSRTRFLFLLQHLRFDDIATRQERKSLDKLAPIRNIFEQFVEKCQSAYTPFEYLTVDEKLEAFRGRCSFLQYMPKKPNKYGLKIYALADAKSFYALNLEVYVGRQPSDQFAVSNSPADVVMRLCKPVYGTGRNITVDNWFSSLSLLEALLKKNLTLLGTIRKNRIEIPQEFATPVARPISSSMFAFHEVATLVSFIPKRNKNVLLLSSLHRDDKIDENTQKPDMIIDYNATKGGVDALDKLCATYNCARNTRRWPMVIFYSLLNVAGINSYVIYNINNPSENKQRRLFLRELGYQLIDNHLRKRAANPATSKTIVSRIKEILQIEDPVVQANTSRAVGRCSYCDRKKNRPTRYSCVVCGKWMCLQHSNFVCSECNLRTTAPEEDEDKLFK